MLKALLRHTGHPQGWMGRFMIWGMNWGHSPLTRWGISQAALTPASRILDVGCGGGAAIARFLKLCPEGKVCGIDISQESVDASQRKNAGAIASGRCEIRQGDVTRLPWEDESFHLVSAFETIYFWSDLPKAFAEIYRVLKPHGAFMICCTTDDPGTKWASLVPDMKARSAETLHDSLSRAGFSDIQILRRPGGQGVCVIGHKS